MFYFSVFKDNINTESFGAIDKGINPAKGNPDAKVTMVEFSDFQCPFCKRVLPVIEKILEEYDIAFYYRHFPLNIHENSFNAALASACANEQGKFWDYHDILFKNQNALNVENLKTYAQEIGLDEIQFNNCLDSEKFKQEIKKNIIDGKALGIDGTPTFFINGKKVVGANEELIRKIIEEESI